MGDLTKNISRHELACKCGCGFDAADIELVHALQDCCDYFAEGLQVEKVSLVFTSGCRCDEHNAKEGGAKSSQHKKAKATDFYIVGVKPDAVADYLEKKYPNKFGIGRYSNRTHLDVRKTLARWDMR